MYKVALWGLGNGYNVFTQLRGHELVKVVACTDRNIFFGGRSIDGIPVVRPEELCDYAFEYLIITVVDDRIFDQIVVDAVSIGIKREMILPLRIFNIPFFNFEDYIRIKESNISILSDYCFGGYLYHRFGMKFLTPTINMYADNNNYYRFISNLHYYMNIQMKEIKNTIDDQYVGLFSFPRGRLDDVEWCFNHDITFESAEERWRKGVGRFNWENYIVIMTIRSDDMAYKFDALPIRHKIGFYWKDLNLESVIYLSEWENPHYRKKYDYDFSLLVNRVADEIHGVRVINWMKALLHEDGFIRVKY